METNRDKFLDRLENSKSAVWGVAQWLSGRGHKVTIPPTFVVPPGGDPKEYADGGDLMIEQRVEVKQLSLEFTGRADFPFPTMLVCAKHSFDNAHPKPFTYIFLNKQGTHAGIVLGATSASWTTREITDPSYDSTQTCYATPLDNVSFVRLTNGH